MSFFEKRCYLAHFPPNRSRSGGNNLSTIRRFIILGSFFIYKHLPCNRECCLDATVEYGKICCATNATVFIRLGALGAYYIFGPQE